MERPFNCIFYTHCHQPAGSGEHTFPAGLGGRRKDKRILCATCNGRFSALDALLAEQLRAINGLLGVVPDYSHEPQTCVALDQKTGTRMEIDHEGMVALAEPHVVREARSGGEVILTVEFKNERQAHDWLLDQRRKGATLKELDRIRGQRYRTEPLKVGWSFGGRDAFREICRIALNFLAQEYPALARDQALERFKDFVYQNGNRSAPSGVFVTC